MSAEHIRTSGLRLSHGGLTRRIDKPAAMLTVGDIVTFGRGAHIVSVEVLDIGARRGPAEEAQTLYRRVECEP